MEPASITLYGHVRTFELPTFGSKVLAVYKGTLDLHGAPVGVTWTRLSQPAPQGSTRVCLQRPVAWPLHSHILITSTDYVKEHAETRVVTSVTNNGLCLGLDNPLTYSHEGVCPCVSLCVSVFVGLTLRSLFPFARM
jgi:hypothetical protein